METNPEKALDTEQEAVDIWRVLDASNPGRYRVDMAAALHNLVLALSALGRPAEALLPAQATVETYRDLAAADPAQYGAKLALFLGSLAAVLDGLGRAEEAKIERRDAARLLGVPPHDADRP
jgi:hypothetical protein